MRRRGPASRHSTKAPFWPVRVNQQSRRPNVVAGSEMQRPAAHAAPWQHRRCGSISSAIPPGNIRPWQGATLGRPVKVYLALQRISIFIVVAVLHSLLSLLDLDY